MTIADNSLDLDLDGMSHAFYSTRANGTVGE